jgi:predicted hotdog family 3-hydroxylacyl-ACP dehydratase
MNSPTLHVADLLPHAGPMVLLDQVVSWEADTMCTAVTVRRDMQFFKHGQGLPAHIAIEWMAQTCGAFVGAEALAAGQPVRIGYLLGSRDFTARVPWFKESSRLEISARLVFRDQEMGVFDCSVREAGQAEALATARLTVYQPPTAMLAETQNSLGKGEAAA